MLKDRRKLVRAEGYSILALVGGSLFLSLGIGATILSTRGIPAVVAMLGALISFLATISLIFVWLVQEYSGE